MLVFLLLALVQIKNSVSDLPIHCLYSQVIGNWEFSISELKEEEQNCGYPSPDSNRYHFENQNFNFASSQQMSINLNHENFVYDSGQQNKRIGSWTMVYDEGFLVKLFRSQTKFFAFMKYAPKTKSVSSDDLSDYNSICDQIMIGWYKQGNKNGCILGRKKNASLINLAYQESRLSLGSKTPSEKKKRYHDQGPGGYVSKIAYEDDDSLFEPDYNLIATINNDNTSTWKAKAYKQFIGKTMKEMSFLLGRRHFNKISPKSQKVEKSQKMKTTPPIGFSLLDLSETDSHITRSSLDWRNHLPPVQNQGSCGSCYAVASVDAFASRFRIASLNRHDSEAYKNLVFSAQDVISCSHKNQGCEGGYPFLVANEGEDRGFILETDFPYQGSDSIQCPKNRNSLRQYKVKNIKYIGGFYGACNEGLMLKELETGPIITAFEARSDLFQYSHGIYHCDSGNSDTRQKSKFGAYPWQKTTHAVVIVGYGEKKITNNVIKYWIVKNSWGADWGVNGYFLIKRGANDCAIESMAVTGTPVF